MMLHLFMCSFLKYVYLSRCKGVYVLLWDDNVCIELDMTYILCRKPMQENMQTAHRENQYARLTNKHSVVLQANAFCFASTKNIFYKKNK